MSQWQNYSFSITKQSDEKILKALIRACEESGFPITSISLATEAGPSIAVQPYMPEAIDGEVTLQTILALHSTLIRSFHVQVAIENSNFSIVITRDPLQPVDIVTVNLSPLGQARIGYQPLAQVTTLGHKLKEYLGALETQAGLSKILGKETRRHYEVREAELLRLEQIATTLVERQAAEVSALRAKLEDEYVALRQRAQEEFDARQRTLAEDFGERESSFRSREEALEHRISEIDDRESRHVRRRIREDLKKELAANSERFELTAGTQDLRKPISIFTIILLVLFGGGVIYYASLTARLLLDAESFTTSVWMSLAVKQALLTIAFGSTAIFFLRWSNRWFERHASEEFRLKRFNLDLDRASWLVEMAMEWKDEKGTEIPDTLLERLSANLFDTGGQPESPMHPADQLASALLGASAEAALELPGGSKLRLDRKGLRALRDEASGSGK